MGLSREEVKEKKLQVNLAFYGGFHRHPINKLIHGIFVPAIAWTVCVWLAMTGPMIPPPLYEPLVQKLPTIPGITPLGIGNYIIPNGAFMAMLIYSNYYMGLQFQAGFSWSFVMGVPIWLTATAFAANVPHAGYYALALFVLSWYLQVHIGHHIYEKRWPALMDNLTQAFLTAPFFVWFEMLFALGFWPELRKAVDALIEKDIELWQARLQKRAEQEKEKQAAEAAGAGSDAKASKKDS